MRFLSIIIPVYNEENFIIKSLKRLNKLSLRWKSEIIVVDDGSNDKTLELIKTYLYKYPKIRLFSKNHEGKGAALLYGIAKAKGNIIIFQDADLEYNPKDIKCLVSAFLNLPGKNVVYGSRFLIKGNYNYFFILHYFGNRFLNGVINLVNRSQLTDYETGYKVAYKKDLNSLKLKEKGFGIETEITLKFLKKGYAIKEIPINFKPRSYSEGKKITILDGINALILILKYTLWRN